MKKILKQVVSLLIDKNYDQIIQESIEKRCNPEDIQAAIESYPGKISMPPNEAFNDFELYKVEDSDEIIIDFFLWFDNQKEDLMIKIILYLDNENKYSFWDILVP